MKTYRQRTSRPRVLVLMVACDAEKTINLAVRRIPEQLAALYDVHVLIVDNASRDSTFAACCIAGKAKDLSFPVYTFYNPTTLGHGGNQKLGYRYAIENGFDFVALLHGDGQYAPELLPDLLAPLSRGEADAVFGSRMRARKGTVSGAMSLIRLVGTEVLSAAQNRLLHAHLSEFHSGYRIFSVAALRAIPFDRNSNGFHFDTEIVIQLLISGRRIREVPIPIDDSEKIRHARGFGYAANVLVAALKARLQEMSLFYDRRFDCAPAETYSPYTPKFDYESPHTLALERVRRGSRVLDLGCAGGYLGSRLRESRQCVVTGMDMKPVKRGALDEFHICDLNAGVPYINAARYDTVLLLDVIEHLNHPEVFLEDLRLKLALNPELELMISTANVACFITRAMLLLGQFNYGPRGILDVTHTRLFTFASLRRALVQAGFDVIEVQGVPPPYPLAIGDNFVSRAFLTANQLLIGLWRGLFSYQIFMRAKAQPSLHTLLAATQRQSGIRASLMESASLTHSLPDQIRQSCNGVPAFRDTQDNNRQSSLPASR